MSIRFGEEDIDLISNKNEVDSVYLVFINKIISLTYVGMSITIPARVISTSQIGKSTTNRILFLCVNSLIGIKQMQKPVNEAQGKYAQTRLIPRICKRDKSNFSLSPAFKPNINARVITNAPTNRTLAIIKYFFATYLSFINYLFLGSQVTLIPSFLRTFWSTAESITVE